MKIKTSELSGSDLDWAVAVALGAHGQETGSKTLKGCKHWVVPGFEPMRWDNWTPSWDWKQGGKLIASHAIGFVGHDADNWQAFSSPEDVTYRGVGPTHLVAACRMIVSAKLGDEIEVPEELA